MITKLRSPRPPQTATTQNGITDKNPLFQTVMMSKSARGKRLKKGVTKKETGIEQRIKIERGLEAEKTSTVTERRTGTVKERGSETGTEKKTEAETGGTETKMIDTVTGTEETAAQKTENGTGKASKIETKETTVQTTEKDTVKENESKTDKTIARRTENGTAKESEIRGTEKARKWTAKGKPRRKKRVRGRLTMIKKKLLWKLKTKVMHNKILVNLQNAAVSRL